MSARVAKWTMIPFMLAVLFGVAMAVAAPRLLPVAALVSTGAAAIGAARYGDRSAQSIVRSALLTVSVFSYPLFLGGSMLTGIATVAVAVLLVGSWSIPEPWRGRVVFIQGATTMLGIGLAAAAAQSLFPQEASLVVLGAIAAFAGCCWSVIPPERGTHRYTALVVVLVLAEGLMVLRGLPTHWVINGVLLGLAFAASFGETRTPRIGYAALLTVLLLSGVQR